MWLLGGFSLLSSFISDVDTDSFFKEDHGTSALDFRHFRISAEISSGFMNFSFAVPLCRTYPARFYHSYYDVLIGKSLFYSRKECLLRRRNQTAASEPPFSLCIRLGTFAEISPPQLFNFPHRNRTTVAVEKSQICSASLPLSLSFFSSLIQASLVTISVCPRQYSFWE